MKVTKDHIPILIVIVGFIIGLMMVIRFIDEFPADGFACITQPCVMPKITIFEWISRLF